MAIVLFTEEPATTDWFPEFDKEKSKGCVTVSDASASALGLYPFLKAFAFTVALLVRVTVPA